MKRQEILNALKNKSPDVLIIGGGINGAATFRELALNGVDVLLIDRADFCSGASSASSHMAHGGIRYLENGEFRLVREAVEERNRLIENAPHIVRPLATVIPIFKKFSGLLNAPLKFLNILNRPAERGALVIKLGLMLYDAYTKDQGTVPLHKFEKRDAALKKFPKLNPQIEYAATYYDGIIKNPERLTLEIILDSEAQGEHARALNYVSFQSADGGTVTLRDEETASLITLTPRLIVNATGAWIDVTNRRMGIASRYIGGTKGSHLVLNNPQLREQIGKHEFFFENKDGRIVLIFPFFDKVIIGTSDIPVEDPDSAVCTDEEINYFIELVGRVFPDIEVKREQIVFQYSGVRPLAVSKAKTASTMARDHLIQEDKLGNIPVYSLVGGKWTTQRAFGEQTADKVFAFLNRLRKVDSKSLPIGGGKNYPWTGFAMITFLNDIEKQTGLGGRILKTLFDRYGTRAMNVARFIMEDENAALKSKPEWTRREILFLIQTEKALHLDDLLLRRTLLAMLGELNLELIDEILEIFEWGEEKKKEERRKTLEVLKTKHGVELH